MVPRTPPQLVLREVDIPITRHTEGIRPRDPRVPRIHTHGPIRRVEDVDTVCLDTTGVDVVIRVSFQTVRNTLLSQPVDGSRRQEFRRGPVGAQPRRGDRVQVTAGDGGPEEGFAVGGEGDAVRAEHQWGDDRVAAHVGVRRLAPG